MVKKTMIFLLFLGFLCVGNINAAQSMETADANLSAESVESYVALFEQIIAENDLLNYDPVSRRCNVTLKEFIVYLQSPLYVPQPHHYVLIKDILNNLSFFVKQKLFRVPVYMGGKKVDEVIVSEFNTSCDVLTRFVESLTPYKPLMIDELLSSYQDGNKRGATLQTLTLGERPLYLQEEIDAIFARLSHPDANQRWGKYYGNEQFYRIFGIKEEKILESLAFAQDGKTDIYIIDVGCAYGGWGTMVMQFLNKNCQDSGKHFHIFSLTGGREQEESIKTVGNATHYRFNEFKAENIDEELLKRGFDLHEKADLIVANWTLRHMVDPLGCLQRLYSLLSSGTGMLLSNSFYFVDEKNPDVIKNILDEWELLASATSGIFAYNPTDFNGCLGDFLLVRLDLAPLTIPLEYAGIKKGIDTRALDTNGGALPIFKKDEQIQKKEPMIVKTSMNSYFCDPASQQSKRFLEYLIDQQILF